MLQLSQERLSALCWRYLLWKFFEVREETTCEQLTQRFEELLEINIPNNDEMSGKAVTNFCEDFHKAIHSLPNPCTELKMEDKSLRNTLAFVISIRIMQRERPWWHRGPGEQAVIDFANKAKIKHEEALQFFNQLSLIVPRF